MHHVLDDKTDKLHKDIHGKMCGIYVTSTKRVFVLTPSGSR